MNGGEEKRLGFESDGGAPDGYSWPNEFGRDADREGFIYQEMNQLVYACQRLTIDLRSVRWATLQFRCEPAVKT